MSIFTKQSIVDVCPAYNTVERESFTQFNIETRNTTEVTNLVAGETLVTQNGHGIFKINSVSSCALESNRCLFEAHSRAVSLGHKCYWINAMPTCLSDADQERVTHIRINFNDIYKFQGKYFKIAEASNNNLTLVEVELN